MSTFMKGIILMECVQTLLQAAEAIFCVKDLLSEVRDQDLNSVNELEIPLV